MNKKIKKENRVMKILTPYLQILPAIVSILLFVVYPVIKAIYMSFFDINLVNASKTKFVGMKNYVGMFQSAAFKKAVVNTSIYTLVMVVAVLIFSLFFAVWLGKKHTKLNQLSQAVIFLPHIISMVSVAMVFTQMMEPNYGIFNSVLSALHLPGSKWLQSSDSAMASVLFISLWKSTGYYTLIFIAALQSIPTSILEASALDNAGELKTFFKITLPMISPQIFFTLIILTIGSFKVFDTIRLTTAGGPNNATTSLVYYIYEQGFVKLDLGRACSGAVVLLAVVLVLTVLYFAALSKKVHYQ